MLKQSLLSLSFSISGYSPFSARFLIDSHLVNGMTTTTPQKSAHLREQNLDPSTRKESTVTPVSMLGMLRARELWKKFSNSTMPLDCLLSQNRG